MHVSVSLCMYALCMCLHVHRGPCPQDFLENTSLRLQSEVKLILAIILHLSPAIQLTLCVHPSMHVSVLSVCARMHVSVHNIMCSVAVLDWYGPEADPVYWRRGRGGGGGRTSGSV